MNQILSMGGSMDTPNGGGNPFGNNQRDKRGPLDTKTTVVIFAIVLIVFGIAMSGIGIFNLVGSLRKKR